MCNRFWFDVFSYHHKNDLVVSHNGYGNEKKNSKQMFI